MMKWLIVGCALILGSAGHACTAFQLEAQDGTKVYCRSLEFGIPLDSNLLIVPRSTSFTGSAPDNQRGMMWISKYGFVGMNQSFESCYVSDGMNEKGLVVGALYLPGFAGYETPDPARLHQTMGCWQIPSFLLSTCASVKEAQIALSKVLVAEQSVPKLGSLPLHFCICDRDGNSLVVEYVNGRRFEQDNPLGVLTNSPPFDWHLLNLSNYVNLSPTNVPMLDLKGFQILFNGQGSGLLGLPGDYSPASRFVRAALFSRWAQMQKCGIDAVKMGFHILNTFDVFDGIIRTQTKSGVQSSDITQWIIVHDRTNLKTYFRDYDTQRIQMVDFANLDFNKRGMRVIVIETQFDAEEVSSQMRPFSTGEK